MIVRTKELVEGGIGKTHIGAQVYVSLRGEVIADWSVGEARPGAAMTHETIVVWLSAGKPLTAAAVGMLLDQGKVSLDDPVAKFIPEFAASGKEAVTVRQLLTHTVGMRTVHTDWPRASWEQTIATLCAAKMEKDWPPGAKAGYNAYTTWYLLGEIVRRVTTLTIDAFLRAKIFSPLGMKDCFLAMTPAEYAEKLPVMAEMQRVIGAGERFESMHFDTEQAATNPRPAGGVRGAVRELGKFYEAMMRMREGASGGAEILSPETARLMTSRVRSGMFDQTFKANIDWGLGFQMNSEHLSPDAPYNFGPYASRETFGHSGSQSSIGMCDPKRQLIVAVSFNGCPGEAAHQKRMRAFLTTLYEELGLA
jgi:CubicO group peptidase (beta-lactamase class C family)